MKNKCEEVAQIEISQWLIRRSTTSKLVVHLNPVTFRARHLGEDQVHRIRNSPGDGLTVVTCERSEMPSVIDNQISARSD